MGAVREFVRLARCIVVVLFSKGSRLDKFGERVSMLTARGSSDIISNSAIGYRFLLRSNRVLYRKADERWSVRLLGGSVT